MNLLEDYKDVILESCFCKNFQDNKWYLYNDEMVTDTNINYIINSNNNHEYIPCILLYQFIKQ